MAHQAGTMEHFDRPDRIPGLPSRFCDSHKRTWCIGKWVRNCRLLIAEGHWRFLSRRVKQFIFKNRQNGPNRGRLLVEELMEGFLLKSSPKTTENGFLVPMWGIMVQTETGGRVNFPDPRLSTQVRRETWAEAPSWTDVKILWGQGLRAHTDLQRTHPSSSCLLQSTHHSFHIWVQLDCIISSQVHPIFTLRSTFIQISWCKKILSYGFKFRSFTEARTDNVSFGSPLKKSAFKYYNCAKER